VIEIRREVTAISQGDEKQEKYYSWYVFSRHKIIIFIFVWTISNHHHVINAPLRSTNTSSVSCNKCSFALNKYMVLYI
jgi:hypothetical protein